MPSLWMRLWRTKRPTASNMPTVNFDESLVTPAIEDHVRLHVASLTEISAVHAKEVVYAALNSIRRGGGLGALSFTLTALEGSHLSARRAGELAQTIWNQAHTLMERDRRLALGITHAQWHYAAPCWLRGERKSQESLRQDAAHKAANGQRFAIDVGLKLDGKWTLPGFEDGCKCVSSPEIPGFDK